MVRFIHTADWQIGMKAVHVGAAGERVREARLAAAKQVVQAVRQHAVDFLVVTGDTFEDNAVDRLLVQRVADILGSCPKPVFLTSGNHDPLVPGSVWEHAAWKAHANLFLLEKAEPLDLAAIGIPGVRLYPCPLLQKHSLVDPTSWISVPSGSTEIALGLAHGTVEGVSTSEIDYPIHRGAARRGGLDYLALGHWHSTATYPDQDGAIRMAYSGTHETTKFGERDSGKVLLVEIAERGQAPRITQLETGQLIWWQEIGRILESGDLARLRALVEARPDAERTLVDLQLQGLLSKEDESELVRIQELLGARFLYARCDASSLTPRPDDERWLETLPAGVLRKVAQQLQQLSDRSQPIPDRAPHATPEVATRALLELYRMMAER